MITAYVAAPFGRKEEARFARKRLEASGIAVKARWIDNHHPNEAVNKEIACLEANHDLEDIAASDILVLVHYPEFAKEGTGGKHFECGYAVALGKPVFVVGQPTSVFHHLKDEVWVVDTVEDAALLAATLVKEPLDETL